MTNGHYSRGRNSQGVRTVMIVAAGLWGSFAGSASAQTSPQLSAALRAAHVAGQVKQADQFAAAPVIPGTVGMPFKVEYVPRDGNSRGIGPTSGHWTYEDGRLLYILSMDMPLKSKTKIFNIGGRRTSGKPYVGSNAFGAKAEITVEDWTLDALAIVSRPKGEPFPATKSYTPSAMVAGATNYWTYDVKADGPMAKALTTAIKVVIEGTLANAPDKSSLFECSTRFVGATIDGPSDVTVNTCWVGANITRIAYVNSATGAVLKEFNEPNAVVEENGIAAALKALRPGA